MFHNTILKIIIVSSIIIIDQIEGSTCPNSESLNNPNFLRPMVKSKVVTLHNWEHLDCCVDGFSKIKWTYRKAQNDNWIDTIPNISIFLDRNRSLQIQSIGPENVGHYKCNASDDQGHWVANQTELRMGCSGIDSNMAIRDVLQYNSFYEHSQCRICCSMSTLYTIFPISTVWLFDQRQSANNWDIFFHGGNEYENESLPSNKGFAWVRTNKEPKICKDKGVTLLKTCIEFNDISVNDTGTYTCLFQKMDDARNYSIEVSVIKVRNYFMAYIGSILVPTLLIVMALLIAWIFYYDIKLVIMTRRSSPDNGKEIDLFIVYDDADIRNVHIAQSIANSLSEFGKKCFIFDRDKKYGATEHEDCLVAISQSKRALFLFTPKTISNAKVIFCFKNYHHKKVYVFYPSRATIIGELRQVEQLDKSIYESVRSSIDYYNWNQGFVRKSFFQKRFIKWLLSHLNNSKKPESKDETGNMDISIMDEM